ncbi:MAG: hypothetical protein L0241_09635 [Planctomycetia bacterium]|nr:hypothetical protein [Planctomycetia bacterium]
MSPTGRQRVFVTGVIVALLSAGIAALGLVTSTIEVAAGWSMGLFTVATVGMGIAVAIMALGTAAKPGKARFGTESKRVADESKLIPVAEGDGLPPTGAEGEVGTEAHPTQDRSKLTPIEAQ